MTKVQFIRKAYELGFSDLWIREALALICREQAKGIKRKYEDYLPKLKYKK